MCIHHCDDCPKAITIFGIIHLRNIFLFCFAGFSSGSLFWDDEDSRNSNAVSGTVPTGDYYHDTRIHYCCRSDGSHNTEIILPIQKPFYLFRYSSRCQRVKYMEVIEEFFRWDDEDSRNRNSKSGSHPYDDGGSENHRLHYCYYVKRTY